MQHIKWALALLLSACAGGGAPSVSAEPAPVPVSLYIVEGYAAIDDDSAVYIFDAAADEIRKQLNTDLMLYSLERVNLGTNGFSSAATFSIILQVVEKWAREHKDLTAKVIHYFVMPPFVEQGEYLHGGAAYVCRVLSTKPAIAWGNASVFDENKEDKLARSQLVMMHELGHVLGAYHDDGICNVMNSFIGAEPDCMFNYSRTAQLQIKNCLRRGRIYIRRKVKRHCEGRKKYRQCRKKVRLRLGLLQ